MVRIRPFTKTVSARVPRSGRDVLSLSLVSGGIGRLQVGKRYRSARQQRVDALGFLAPGNERVEEKIEGPNGKEQQDYANPIDCHRGEAQLCDVHERVRVKSGDRALPDGQDELGGGPKCGQQECLPSNSGVQPEEYPAQDGEEQDYIVQSNVGCGGNANESRQWRQDEMVDGEGNGDPEH